MKQLLSTRRISQLTAGLVVVIIVVIPFHAFVTVWASSAIGHYTALRLWKEVLLLIAGLGALLLLCRKPALRRELKDGWLWRLIGVFIVVNLLWGIVAHLHGAVTTKALLYGELIDLRPFAMLVVAWVAASSVGWLYRHWQRLVLWPAAGVVAIGLLQYFVLPYDVMKHFGYDATTISPYETIDHKTSYIRVRSTLRGANLLGAYLLLVLPSLASVWRIRRRLLVAIGGLAALACLFASGSRGAWLGAAVAGTVWLALQLPRRYRHYLLLAIVCLALLAGLALYGLRHNDAFENTFFHTDEHSTSKVSSNAAHLSASHAALVEVVRQPLGQGPGTAGPASFYNTGYSARIAENNFLQIGQETGWLGLILFVAIFGLLAQALWQRRQLALTRTLLAALAGLSVMALLMHVWTDDTIAYLFFGLAGIAVAQPASASKARPPRKSRAL